MDECFKKGDRLPFKYIEFKGHKKLGSFERFKFTHWLDTVKRKDDLYHFYDDDLRFTPKHGTTMTALPGFFLVARIGGRIDFLDKEEFSEQYVALG